MTTKLMTRTDTAPSKVPMQTAAPATIKVVNPGTQNSTTQPTLPWGSNTRTLAIDLMTETRSLLRIDAPDRLKRALAACEQNDLDALEAEVTNLFHDVKDFLAYYDATVERHGDLIAALGGITELPNHPEDLSI